MVSFRGQLKLELRPDWFNSPPGPTSVFEFVTISILIRKIKSSIGRLPKFLQLATGEEEEGSGLS